MTEIHPSGNSLNVKNWVLIWDIDESFVSLQNLLFVLTFNMSNLLAIDYGFFVNDKKIFTGGSKQLFRATMSAEKCYTYRLSFIE